jgi:hypothetical protein
VREQRVSTPDGRFWYVRRRWARRQLPGRRRKVYELSRAEREAVRVLPDSDDVAGWYFRNFTVDAESWIVVVVGLGLLVAVGGAVLIVERVVPFLADNALVIAAGLAAVAALVLADRLTRPWFIEAESGRMVKAPRRVWRVQGWWRARRVFRAVAEAVAEGRIDSEHGAIVFTDRPAKW